MELLLRDVVVQLQSRRWGGELQHADCPRQRSFPLNKLTLFVTLPEQPARFEVACEKETGPFRSKSHPVNLEPVNHSPGPIITMSTTSNDTRRAPTNLQDTPSLSCSRQLWLGRDLPTGLN